jgi:hypothetical protein
MVRLLESEMKALTAPALTTFALVLAACGGSSGSSSNGASSYNGMYADINSLADSVVELDSTRTSEMPTSGRATYSGQAAFATDPDADAPEMMADAALIANFNNERVAGQLSNFRDDENNAIAGTVEIERDRIDGNGFTNNLSGTLTVDGEAQTVAGTMVSEFVGPDAGYVVGLIEGTVGGEYVAGLLIAEQQ